MELTTADVAEATGGEVFGRETVVSGTSIDTRTLRRGQLFVPIVDERDGHDFIGAAVHAGAAAYLTEGPIEAGVAIRVADTRAALLELGRLARTRLAAQVVGVTGSVGKTTTKDLLAAVLGSTFLTAASKASFNNELGVPLTLLEAADDANAAVIEMGARGVGHIAMLCEVARPTIGVVTVVAGSHLESFGTL
ncbi:MAG TPA: Mur ligase family protein, partial [Acidimicrobiales bacterium]